jgi:hypothetical protein
MLKITMATLSRCLRVRDGDGDGYALRKARAQEGDGYALEMAMATDSRWLQAREGDGYRLERVMAPDDGYTLYRDDGYGRETMATSTIWWL